MLRPGHRYALQQLLPHGPGMFLLDRLVEYDADSVTCELTVRAESRFAGPEGVPAWAGIEYMAQTLGAFTSMARRQAGRAVQVELLLGTRAYDCKVAHFAIGTHLTVRARLLYLDSQGICAFACEIHDGATLLAKASIKGYGPEDIEPFLKRLEAGEDIE